MSGPRLSDKAYAEAKHSYTNPKTGKRVTSVSAVVGVFDSGDKLGRGAAAAVKLQKAGINYRSQWDDKRDIGTRVHGYASRWLQGDTVDVAEQDMGHMEAFARWCNLVRPEWMHTERAGIGTVACPAGPCAICADTGELSYGGRFDAVGVWDDLFTLVDFKSGRSYRRELTIQLAGYAGFDGLLVYDDDGMAVGLDPMPHIDRWCGLYITADGVQAVVCPDPNKVSADWPEEAHRREAFETFKQLLFVKEWSKQMERKGR